MILNSKIAAAEGLEQEDAARLERLVATFNNHSTANETKRRYYEGHIPLSEVNLGLALPTQETGGDPAGGSEERPAEDGGRHVR